jgi:hypothetical protein
MLGFERRWLAAIFETVVPFRQLGEGSLAVPEAPIERFIDDLVEKAPFHFLLGLRACLWAVMLAPPFVLGRYRTFLGLPSDERLALLSRLGESDRYVVREMPLLFKTIACLAVCGLPDVQAKIGIHPVDTLPPAWARSASGSPNRHLPRAGR